MSGVTLWVINRKLNWLMREVRALRLDDHNRAIGEYEMAKDILEEIRQARTVQQGLIIRDREQRAQLEAVRKELADAQMNTAKIDDALALLDEMEAEGNAALVEGTAAADEPTEDDEEQPPFNPSGN